MKSMKNSKNILIAALLFSVLVMSIGYATFSSRTTVKGNAEIVGEWDVEITDVSIQSTKGSGNGGVPIFTPSTATFNADLRHPGDSVTYSITITNKGNVDAVLASASFQEQQDGSPAIVYSHTQPANFITANGGTTTFTVTATYDSSVTVVPDITTKSITGIFEYKQSN
ncbi:MAG: hypothetical protein IKO49_08085 [Bacilli bacterium]|nr:hypothetical protein [Bacilli bacterium]